MATYATLSAEDKALIDELVKQLRAYSGETNQLLRRGRIISDLFATGGTTLLASLDVGDIIPNVSNLAGAQSLTKEDCETIVGDINTALGFFSSDVKRQLQVKAAGSNAI